MAQCTDGTQPECTCETAQVLCSVDELDGFVFSMSGYMHPEDGPTPICSSAPSSQTNNPTWFAFTAWCSNLTLRARPSNCEEVQNVVGVQIAIYEDCTFDNEVACDVSILDCNTGTKVLVMTGLTVGGVYYFMVDGCLGSYCTVTIDVVGVCGEEEIAPWTMPVTGELDPCAGDTETYTVENLNGADTYHWYVDGNLITQTPSTAFNITWSNPGSYQLCVDASHEPCVPVSDQPSPLCVTIVVHDTDAGVLDVSPSPLCLNELASISSTGYASGADNTQILVITDDAGIIVDVILDAIGLFTSGTNGTYTVYAYNFLTISGTVPAIGSNISELECSTACCDLISQSITFQGIEAMVSNIICQNNGTDNDPSDDTFTFDVLVSGQTPGTQWRSSDGTLDGTYGTIRNCGPYSIIGGTLNFDLQDFDVPACFVSITVDPPSACSFCLQTVDAGAGSTIDCNITSATLIGTTSGSGTFFWTGPNAFISKALTITVIDSGWYYLNATFANQCTGIDSAFVDMDTDEPLANAGPDLEIDCNQSEVFLDGSASSGSNLQYQWTNESGLELSDQSGLLADAAGIYTLVVTNSINGCVSTDNVEVILDPGIPENIIASVVPENCIGENNGIIEVTSTGGGIPPYSYSLNGLVTNTSGVFPDLSPGAYTLQITDSDGCMIDTFFTIFEGLDLQLELPPFIELIAGQSGFIEAKVNVPTEDLSTIQWSPPGFLSCDTCLITTMDALGAYTFLLTVVHQDGCVATAELNITVVPETDIYIPNVFSPNGDGYNDYFTLYANERVDRIIGLNVFDRWGEFVFQRNQFNANDDSMGWDGTFRGKALMPSVYVYIFEVLLTNGATERFSGNVSLVR